MFKSADILREASRTTRTTILSAGLRQRTQLTCQSNSLCYQMSHMHTEKNARHNGLQQTSTVGEYSWSSLWPKEIHQDLWDCTGLPTSFLTGRSCWPSGSCGWEALRTHGRTPWSSLGHCWNRFRRFNLATNLPSELCETEKYMSGVMDVMVFVRLGKPGGISHPCRVQHRLGRGRSSSQFLVQFVIEKTTAPNAYLCCRGSPSIVSNPPQRSKESDEHFRKDESS